MKVRKATPGGPITTVFQSTGLLYGIDIDPLGGRVYWTESELDKVRSSNLDGTDVRDLVTITPPAGQQSTLRDVAVDPATGRMYFIDATDFGHAKNFYRANLDGTGAQVIRTEDPDGQGGPTPIDLDLVNGKMYWTDFVDNEVQRSNLDGSNVETLIPGVYTSGIALDVANNKMYLTRRKPAGVTGPFTYSIATANLDGTGLADLSTTGVNDPRGIDLDLDARKAYFADLGSDRILRVNMDGTGLPEVVASGLDNPIDVTLVPEPTSIALLGLGSLALLARRRRHACTPNEGNV